MPKWKTKRRRRHYHCERNLRMTPPNAEGRSLRGLQQTQSSGIEITFTQSRRRRALKKYSTARLGRLLSISPPGSVWRRAIQTELQFRLQEAIRQIEKEFSL